MGKTMNGSDLWKRPFSELTISEQAAVLKARYDEETSERSSQRIKTRETIGEEYGLSGSSVGRLLKIHHKLPLSEGGTHDQSNLIALCKSCHSTIPAKRGDYWGRTMSSGHRSCADRSGAEPHRG